MKKLSGIITFILAISILLLLYCTQTTIIKEPFTTKEYGTCKQSNSEKNSITSRDVYPILKDEEKFIDTRFSENIKGKFTDVIVENKPELVEKELPGLMTVHQHHLQRLQ